MVLTAQLSRCPTDLASLRDRTLHTIQDKPVKHESRRVSRRRSHRLCVSEAAAVTEQYLAGTSMQELAAKFGVHRTTISDCLRKVNVPLRRQGLRPEDVPTAVKLYQEGWSLAKLAAKYNCDDATVRHRLIEYGVVIRPRRERRY